MFLSEQETEDLRALTNRLRDELDYLEYEAQKAHREENPKRDELLEELFELEMIGASSEPQFEDPYGDRFLTDDQPPY